MSGFSGGNSASEKRKAFIALGSNVGDRLGYLRGAVRAFNELTEITVEGTSPVYESPAHTLHPDEVAPPFFNAVIAISTSLSPEGLLEECLAVERRAGRRRERVRRWAPRTLDCDLLVVDTERRTTEALTLPHPRLHERRFVLEPLADLAPNLYIPPPHDATVRQLLTRCTDPIEPQRLEMALLPSSTTDSA